MTPIPDQHTYVLEHNPNCPSAYKVRIPRGVIDQRPDLVTRDAIGYGHTFEQAFAAAYAERVNGKFDA